MFNENSIALVLRKNTWLKMIRRGWGNGYVGVPKGHPWFGVHYDEIDANVHGMLTFSEMDVFGAGYWWVGFDTCRPGDNEINCNIEFVAQQAESLHQQAVDAAITKQLPSPDADGDVVYAEFTVVE